MRGSLGVGKRLKPFFSVTQLKRYDRRSGYSGLLSARLVRSVPLSFLYPLSSTVPSTLHMRAYDQLCSHHDDQIGLYTCLKYPKPLMNKTDG